MQRLRVFLTLIVGSVLILAMVACGGSTPTANVASTVKITPSKVSLNRGQVSSVVGAASDSNGGNVTVDLIYTSSNSSLVSVSNAGALCAGKWDTNFVVCTPATSTGVATVTVSVAKEPSISATTTVYVHERVDRVEMNATHTSCLSSGQTEQLTATAYSTDAAVCSSMGATAPCALPDSTLGNFIYTAADPDVVTVDNINTPGNATAKGPGLTTVSARVSGVNSTAQPFLVCPITKLTFNNGTDTTPITIAKAATKTMYVTATDSAGITLTNPPVSYFSNNTYAMSIAAGTSSSSGTVTGANSGSSAYLWAACVPPTCNKNLNAVYAPGIMGNVSGTYNAPVVYVASTKSLSMYPVDMSNSSVGTEIKLPYLPNSFLLNHQGTAAVLGSDSNPLMLLSTAGPTVSTIQGLSGAKALAMSPDGDFAVVGNSSATYLLNVASSTVTMGSTYGAAVKAAFTPDSKYALFTRGNSTLYAFDITNNRILIFNEGSAISDIATLANGSLTYLAEPGVIDVVGNCNLQNPGFVDTQNATSPSLLTSVLNGTGIMGVDSGNLLYVKVAGVDQACPPTVQESTTSIPLGFSTGTPQQILSTYDGAKGVVSSTGSQVAVVTLSSATVANATLSGSATVAGKGDITGDSATLYIGGSDNALHKIDLASTSDTAQVSVSLKDSNGAVVAPDLVQVRNK